MSDSHIEGTFCLDGILEGKIVCEDQESYIHHFVEQAAQEGIRFNLSVKGAYFSLLPDCHPVVLKPGESAHTLVERRLGGLLRHFTTAATAELMSTLRSVQYTSGQAIQTLYLIDPHGNVSREQRTIQAQTIAPTRPMSRSQRLKLAGIVGLALIVGLSLSALVVPYPQILKRAISNLKSADLEDLAVRAPDFEAFFAIDSLSLNQAHTQLIITCKTTDAYPRTREALDQAWSQPGLSLPRKLVYEALARQVLRCELYDNQGTCMTQAHCLIRWSSDEVDTFSIAVPFARSLRQVNISF